MFPAACVAKVVTVTAPVPAPVIPGAPALPDVPTPWPVADATILSEGVGPSTGMAFVDASGVTYIPESTAADLKRTIDALGDVLGSVTDGLDKAVEAFDKAVQALGKAQTALTTLDTHGFLIGATAGVPSPPVAAADIAGIGTASAQVTAAAAGITAASTQLQGLALQLETIGETLV